MMSIQGTTPLKSGIAKKLWFTPELQILDINQAAGALAGPLCDKYGSISATQGNDSCGANPKP